MAGNGEIKTRWHNTDHRVWICVQVNRLPYNFRLRPEATFPETVTQHYYMIPPGLFLLSRKKGSPQPGLDRQYAEKIRGDATSFYIFRVINARECEASALERRHVLENLVLFLEVQEVGC